MKQEIYVLLLLLLLLMFLLCLCLNGEDVGTNEVTSSTEKNDIPTGGQEKYVSIDGTWFYESDYSYETSVPEGYKYKYTFFHGHFSHYELFTSEENTIWVYLRKESNPSCVKRMVDNRVWGKKLISYQNKTYIAMSTIYGIQDVGKDIWDNREKIYYCKEELGEISSIGMAVFSGYDTVPSGTLASNQPEQEVFCSSEYRASIFVAVSSDDNLDHNAFERYVCWQWDI